MSFTKWANSKCKKLNWIDIQCIKLSVFAIALALAKIWPEILGLDLYVYLVIAVLAALVPLKKIFA